MGILARLFGAIGATLAKALAPVNRNIANLLVTTGSALHTASQTVSALGARFAGKEKSTLPYIDYINEPRHYLEKIDPSEVLPDALAIRRPTLPYMTETGTFYSYEVAITVEYGRGGAQRTFNKFVHVTSMIPTHVAIELGVIELADSFKIDTKPRSHGGTGNVEIVSTSLIKVRKYNE